ncbi:hypothetical protein BDY21DRAFT_27906 [Lineolata rhizophorae]|uniref:Uncharacterized protein n=1 Tax=Lineolata rhizophorae TaxID=578093 RepID=A0A6A6P0P3_9PEZI|nr:hypothetical protein BDY21DRAFT_27906 [Lineolata rhizophorae]
MEYPEVLVRTRDYSNQVPILAILYKLSAMENAQEPLFSEVVVVFSPPRIPPPSRISQAIIEPEASPFQSSSTPTSATPVRTSSAVVVVHPSEPPQPGPWCHDTSPPNNNATGRSPSSLPPRRKPLERVPTGPNPAQPFSPPTNPFRSTQDPTTLAPTAVTFRASLTSVRHAAFPSARPSQSERDGSLGTNLAPFREAQPAGPAVAKRARAGRDWSLGGRAASR